MTNQTKNEISIIKQLKQYNKNENNTFYLDNIYNLQYCIAYSYLDNSYSLKNKYKYTYNNEYDIVGKEYQHICKNIHGKLITNEYTRIWTYFDDIQQLKT